MAVPHRAVITVNGRSPQSRCSDELGWLYSRSDLGILVADHVRPCNAVVADSSAGHDLPMDEYNWPTRHPDVPGQSPEEVWTATLAALPLGTSVAGEVVARQPFGVFIRVDGVPNAMALAEITAMPEGMGPPALGVRIRGEVIDHVEHNHQVRVRLH